MKKSSDSLFLFTDASVSPQNQIAVGGFFFVLEYEFNSLSLIELFERMDKSICYKEFSSGQSTRVEILSIIAALNFIKNTHSKVKLFTDCQGVCHLLGARRAKLERNKFMTRAGKSLASADLYRELFVMVDAFELTSVKMEGHKAKKLKQTREDSIFQFLDKSVRKKLRYTLAKRF